MAMHPQDVVVALKLALGPGDLSYAALAQALSLSASQVHASVGRLRTSGLVAASERRVNRKALVEFLIHGLKYVYPPERGPIARGVPTAHSAPPLSDVIASDGDSVVWPDPQGDARGESLLPLHRCVPDAARQDASLYQALALVDAVRAGRARERKEATSALKKLLSGGRRSRPNQVHAP